jgi:hypothetical protein
MQQYLDEITFDISFVTDPVNISFFDQTNQVAKLLSPPVILSVCKSKRDY